MLTVGMAMCGDYDGVVFSLESLRLGEDLRDVELLVVDNRPDHPDSQHVQNFLGSIHKRGNAGTKYIAMPQPVGTSPPRNRVFAEAAGEIVVCMDSHVLLRPGTLGRLRGWYERHPDSQDLISGPILWDGHDWATHFNPVWRAEMWGIWGNAWRKPCDGTTFSVIDDQDRCKALPVCCDGVLPELADVPFPGHERVLAERGFVLRGGDADEFDVPGQGLGLFSCRKNAWLGFNSDFRGFGGEELYIHEKFRQAGRRNLCLGFLKWWHRFHRPRGVQYPLTRWNKVRNYVLGHLELGLPLDPIHEHFVAAGLFPHDEWDALLKDPQNPMPVKARQTPSSPPRPLNVIYEASKRQPRDLNEHFQLLAEVAGRCEHVTEISRRRESILPLLLSGAPKIVSYTTEPDGLYQEAIAANAGTEQTVETHQIYDGTLSGPVIEVAPTDLLFIGSGTTAARLSDELRKFALAVRRYIVLHSTAEAGNGGKGEDGGPGLLTAVRTLVEAKDSPWFIHWHTEAQYGLTILSRYPAERPPDPIVLWDPGFGPGTELSFLLTEELGIVEPENCSCAAVRRNMDRAGVAGCRKYRDQFLGMILQNYALWGWKDKLQLAAAGKRAIAPKWMGGAGLALKINPLHPIESCYDLAVERAEEKQARKEAA